MKKKKNKLVFFAGLAFALVFMAALITSARRGQQAESAAANVEPQYENVLEEFQMGQ